MPAPRPGLLDAQKKGSIVTGKDPFWNQVALLLHLDGANGQTTYTDSSPLNAAMANNGAALTTAQAMFGPSSLDVNGSSGIDGVAANMVFGSGDFTMEGWCRPTALGSAGGRAIIDLRTTTAGNTTWPALFVWWDGGLWFTYGDASGPLGFVTSAAGLVAPNVWSHCAASRVAGVLRLFVNGVQVQAVSDATVADAVRCHIGYSEFSTGNFTGQIDEVRVTKAGRYSGSFTPPSAAFPNS